VENHSTHDFYSLSPCEVDLETPFSIFNFDLKYDINNEELKKKYFNLRIRFHPDSVSSYESHAIAQANEIYQKVFDAYQILRDPIRRAAYILNHLGLADEISRVSVEDDIELILNENEFLETITHQHEVEDFLEKQMNKLKQLEENFSQAVLAKDIEKMLRNYKLMTFSSSLIKKIKNKKYITHKQ